MSMDSYSEDALIEQPAIALFSRLGWETANCFHETFGPNGTLGRETSADAVLASRLRPALRKLNPGVPIESIDRAVEEITRDRSAMRPAQANREVCYPIKNSVGLSARREREKETAAPVRVID